jgi:hypothetical protein
MQNAKCKMQNAKCKMFNYFFLINENFMQELKMSAPRILSPGLNQ